MNNDLISRSALIGVLRSAVDNLTSVYESGVGKQDGAILSYGICVLSEAIRHAETAPAVDTVPVVRCRDCRHRKDYVLGEPFSICGIAGYVVNPENYCHKGERNGGDHETD